MAIAHHLLLCATPTNNLCSPDDPAVGLASWERLKALVRELELEKPGRPGGIVLRNKADCLRICASGPILLIWPEGIVYGGVTPERIERIQQAVSIPVMAKCRIGHFAEAQVLALVARVGHERHDGAVLVHVVVVDVRKQVLDALHDGHVDVVRRRRDVLVALAREDVVAVVVGLGVAVLAVLVFWLLAPVLAPLGLQVAWLTGSQKKKERDAMLALVASGEAALVGQADPLRPPRRQPLPLAGTAVAARPESPPPPPPPR
jgi:(2Fe-2S) ferredoxin